MQTRGNMQELRAICRNGDVYTIIKRGDLPYQSKDWKDIRDRVRTKMNTEYKDIVEKAKTSPKDSSERFLYDQKIADVLIEELGDIVEYVKYE